MRWYRAQAPNGRREARSEKELNDTLGPAMVLWRGDTKLEAPFLLGAAPAGRTYLVFVGDPVAGAGWQVYHKGGVFKTAAMAVADRARQWPPGDPRTSRLR
jgi:hypothetical protein